MRETGAGSRPRVILGIDAICPPLTGIGRYALALARGLERHAGVAQLKFYARGGWLAEPTALLRPGRPVNVLRRHMPFRPLARRAYHNVMGVISRAKLAKYQNWVFHAPNYIPPEFAARVVCTLHDLSHLRMPECHPRDRVEHLLRELPRTLEHAAHVITVSNFVRDEVIAEFGLPPERVTTVYHGVDASFHPREAGMLEGVLGRYGLQRGSYVLAVATLEPRKNLERLIDALRRLPAPMRRAFPLVLVGDRGWRNEGLLRSIDALRSEGELHWPGYVSEEDLPSLYAGAAGFAYPSLYEGFGLPVLEAMASGVPVLTSDRASLPEVAGDAALLVDPEDVGCIARSLERLLEDAGWREGAAKRGLARAAAFTWETCIDSTVAIYREVGEG